MDTPDRRDRQMGFCYGAVCRALEVPAPSLMAMDAADPAVLDPMRQGWHDGLVAGAGRVGESAPARNALVLGAGHRGTEQVLNNVWERISCGEVCGNYSLTSRQAGLHTPPRASPPS